MFIFIIVKYLYLNLEKYLMFQKYVYSIKKKNQKLLLYKEIGSVKIALILILYTITVVLFVNMDGLVNVNVHQINGNVIIAHFIIQKFNFIVKFATKHVLI